MPEKQDDLKGDGGQPGAGNGQPADKGGGGGGASGDDAETVTIKKSELEKIKTDRDNYKAGLLAKKAEDRQLGGDGGKKDDKGGDGGGQPAVDPKEIAAQASTAVLSTLGTTNENRAKLKFLRDHSEYVDDAAWADMMTDFSKKRGNASVEDVLDDLGDAHILRLRRLGKLEEHLKSERERGRQEGERAAAERDFRAAGGAGQPAGGGGQPAKLSPEGEVIAKGMHVDPEAAAKIQTELPRSDEGGYQLPVGKPRK